jgi:glycosyltransferase involved in cell wall biosynthesis
VHVLTTHGGRGTVSDVVDGVAVHRLSPHNLYWCNQPDQPPALLRMAWHGLDSFNPGVYLQARKLLGGLRPAVISSHNLSGLSVAVWQAAADLGIPVVQVLRDYYNLCPKGTMHKGGCRCERVCGSCRALRLPHERLSRKVAAVVGCSQAVLDKHLALGLFEGVPYREVIYNAERIPDARKPDLTSQPITFGYIGAISQVKGVEGLIQAFEAARAASPTPMRLLLAGSGQTSYVQSLETAHASEHVQFLGHVAPASLFAQVHVSVVPSTWDDPLPGVVFQALAHHVPVLGARRGGIPEMVRDGINGLLFDPDQEDGLTHAMLRVVSESQLLARMSAEARATACVFLDEDRLFKAYLELYQKVLKN